ncbi:5100_t:CDS:1, partial [Gigaspora margarita]
FAINNGPEIQKNQSSKPKVVNTAINSGTKVKKNQFSKSKYNFQWGNVFNKAVIYVV